MSFVLDTSLLSALMRSEPAASARLLAAHPAEVALVQPVLAEVRYGLARLPRSKRRRMLEERLAVMLAAMSRAAWTDAVSEHFGAVKADLERRGERVDDFDVAIAAHALAFEATLVTRNIRHFARIRGLALETWMH